MRNIRLTLQYDGSRFHGFQRQAGALRTVQSELERVLGIITKAPVHVTGAGRTDAGVHARGQVTAFRTESTIPTDRIPLAVNGFFEQDLVCLAADEVPSEFHPQRDAIAKAYSYTIDNTLRPSPFLRLYAAHVPEPLAVDAMRTAAALLVGRHDFRSFQAADRDLIIITAEADGFLYHMVRNLAGLLIAIGRGRLPPTAAATILAAADRRVAPATAPPQALCLEWVRY